MISLGLVAPIVSAIGFPEVAIAQENTGEIDRAISEGSQLFKEGSAGSLRKAIGQFEKALELARSAKRKKEEVLALFILGNLNDGLGYKSKAIDYYYQAFAESLIFGDRQMAAVISISLGKVHLSLGENQTALKYQNLALSLLNTVDDRGMKATILNNIGLIYYNLGEKQKALEYYNQALPILRALGIRSVEAMTLNNIGAVYLELGEKQKALEYYNLALPILRASDLRASGIRPIEAMALNNIGFVYSELGEKQKALEHYNQALVISRTVGDRSTEAKTLNNIGFSFGYQKPEFAIFFFKQSVNLLESLRKDIHKLPRETQEIYTSSVANTYRALADALLTQGRTREAQSVLELLKVQESQGYGKDQDANVASIQFPFHPLESQALQAFEKTIASKSLTSETLNPIVQPLTQNRDRITQDMNAMPIAIGNPQSLLKATPNALLIQNLVVGDKLWVLWTNSSGNVKAIVVPNVSQKQLDETVKTFRGQIGNPTSNLNDLKATSTKLYNWLIPTELQAELKNNPKQQLLFSLDHVTRYIPVAALYDGKDYLAQRYILSNLITVDIDVRDRLSPDGSAPTILGLGTTKAYPGFSALPNVEAELSAIVKDNTGLGIYPGKIQLDQAFTAKSLSQNLDSYRVLHIATHGSFNPKSITDSFLLLGNGDRLPITSIASLKNLTNTHLVVLSACETGLSGAGQDGTEISGIGGYFLRRGAKSVLASLWSVNDASTALLIQQFYKNLSQTKLTKAQALQKVQQDFISGQFTTKEATTLRGVRVRIEGQPPPDSFAHPYFWAPFTLTGNPN